MNVILVCIIWNTLEKAVEIRRLVLPNGVRNGVTDSVVVNIGEDETPFGKTLHALGEDAPALGKCGVNSVGDKHKGGDIA